MAVKDAGELEKKSRARRKRKNSNKGALIKGMTRRLPVQLLGDLSFEEGLKKIMRGYAGVYALYNGERLYYVGLATNLYNRLRWHTKNRHRGKWDRFAIFRVRRVRYLKDMETLLLQVAEPPGNTLSGHLHRDADLTRILREVLRENTLRLKRLRKAFA
jgi:GIY-YIG catalytic domain